MDPTERARCFLQANRMYHGDVDALQCTREFTAEMEAGLAGRPSSLRMIPTFVQVDEELPAAAPVIAMDAGGTNLRVGLVSFDVQGEPRISELERFRMPGLDGEITAEAFFEVLGGHVSRLATRSGRAGVSFSFPAEILPSHDGRIVGLSKELRVTGIAGALVGERINQALRAGGAGGALRFVVLNDTVGALLAGRAAQAGERHSRFVGFVLGTGLNCAYVEANDRIAKQVGLAPGGRQIINVESGAYAGGPRGSIDQALDQASAEPGQYLLEKTISGAYLGALCLRTLQAAAEDGLFSPGARACLDECPRLETADLDPFLGADRPAELHAELLRRGTAEDLATARSLAEHILERAAKLAAVTMAAALLKSAPTGPADAPACVTVDGSTYYRLPSYRERIVRWVDQLLAGKMRYRVATVENAALIGAAVGGLTN